MPADCGFGEAVWTMDNTQALIQAIDGGYVAHFVFFWGHTGSGPEVGKTCLSQWYPSPFSVDGRAYPTAEHWMMAEKARLFSDEEARERILSSSHPGQAKKLGRAVRGFDSAVWERHRSSIVKQGNPHKFEAHPELRSFLVGTGDKVLVEASPEDRIWGIGWSERDPEASDPRAWRGLNLLGFGLMAVRAELQGHGWTKAPLDPGPRSAN